MRNFDLRYGGKMLEGDWNHCRIVGESINGKREVNEQTFSSLAILSERLERLNKLDSAFSEIEFSPAVQELEGQQNAVAVG